MGKPGTRSRRTDARTRARRRSTRALGLALLSASALVYSACGDDSDDGAVGGASGDAGAAGSGEFPSGAGGEITQAGTSNAGGSSGAPGGGSGGTVESSGGTGGSSGSGTAGNGGTATAGSSSGGTTGGTSTAGSSGIGTSGAGAGGDTPGGAGGQAGGDASGGFGGATGGSGGETAEGGSAGAGGDEGFCATLGPIPAGVSARQCFDFGSSSGADAFTPKAGVWEIAGDRYRGTGPEDAPTCVGGGEHGTLVTGSLSSSFSAADVRVSAKLTGVDSPDKVIILRSADSDNRIELNFRANFESEGSTQGGDLSVQELVDCVSTYRIDVAQVSIPHALTDTLNVEVELRGQSLTVLVDGDEVIDTVFTTPNLLRTAAGSVGLGVFRGGTVEFDDVVIEALE